MGKRQSIYYSQALARFNQAKQDRKKAKKSFVETKSKEAHERYRRAEDKMHEFMAELIKLGADAVDFDGDTTVEIEGELYEIKNEYLCRYMTKEEVEMIFGSAHDSEPLDELPIGGTEKAQEPDGSLDSNLAEKEKPFETDNIDEETDRPAEPESPEKEAEGDENEAGDTPDYQKNATNGDEKMLPKRDENRGENEKMQQMNPYPVQPVQPFQPFGMLDSAQIVGPNTFAYMFSAVPYAAKEFQNSGDDNEDIKSLKRKIIIMEQENEWARDDVESIKEKYNNLKKDMQARIDESRDENANLKKQLEELKAQENGTDEITVQKDIEIAEMSSRISKYEEEGSRLSEKITAMQGELEAARKESSHKAEEYEEKIAQSENKLMEVSGENTSLKQKKQELEKEKQELEQKLEKCKGNEAGVAEKQKELEKLQGTLSGIEAENKKLKDEIGHLKTQLAEKDSEIETLKKEQAGQGAASDESRKKISDLEQKLKEANNRADKSDAQCKQEKTRVDEKSKEVENLKKEIAQIKESSKESKEDTAKITELEKTMEELKKQKEELDKIAYTDQRSGMPNAAAFNRDAKQINPKKHMMARVGVYGFFDSCVKEGFSNASKKVQAVAAELLENFGKGVYRVTDDSFTIVGRDYAQIHGIIEDMERKLWDDDIELYYGFSSKSSVSRKDMLATAEDDMWDMYNKLKDTHDSESTGVTPAEEPQADTPAVQEPENSGSYADADEDDDDLADFFADEI